MKNNWTEGKCLSKSFTPTGKSEEQEFTVLGGLPGISQGNPRNITQKMYELSCDSCNHKRWNSSTKGNMLCTQPKGGK